MISGDPNPDNKIPVMGFFVSPDVIIETDIDDIVSAIDPEENDVQDFPFKKVATLSPINDHELMIRCNVETGQLDMYVGYKNKEINANEDIQHRFPVPLFKVSLALDDFIKKAEKFVEIEDAKEKAAQEKKD